MSQPGLRTQNKDSGGYVGTEKEEWLSRMIQHVKETLKHCWNINWNKQAWWKQLEAKGNSRLFE